ncbi:MAG TPA: ankyrin repeat domain-containing protein, partial [Vicinamibacterales bacterium]|nr:ankyrin repeat domain-containing protein [Vicinamibacterales bacterium]
MERTFGRLLLQMTAVSVALVGLSPSMARPSAQSVGAVDFARDVQPVLRANCYGCHGPTLQNGNLRLDRRRDAMPNRVGANGARVVPGNSGASRLYLRIAGATAGLQMPPTEPLTAEQVAIIKTWIDQGADWPDALAGETPSPARDQAAVQLMDALRAGHNQEFERLLRTSPHTARSKGTGGSTALMFAALYADASAVQRLLDRGADPNARNDAGATALLWAVDDVEKTRLLLSHGADPNVRSDDGATPVLLAAGRFGALDVLKALVDSGAKLTGQPVLGRAAGAGDEDLMRYLLEHGAPRSSTARDLTSAMRSGCSPCVDLLLESATPDQLSRALGEAAAIGDSTRVRVLLDRGAQVTGDALR